MAERQQDIIKNGNGAEPEMGYVLSGIRDYDGRFGEPIILGLGTPPIGIAPELEIPLAERKSGKDLVHYSEDPLHTETRRLIIEGIGLTGVGPESVVPNGNGSYGAGDEVVRYLALEGYDRILVTNYSFPNVAQWAARHRVTYSPVNTDSLNPLDSLRNVLALGNEDLKNSIVYLDYPNNPFGLADPELLRRVVEHASAHGAVPILDGAFGEVLGEEHKNSIQHTLDHDGIALGSITKTQGGAKLRAGWSIMARKFTENGYTDDQRMVFGLNDEAEFALRHLHSRNIEGKTLAQIHAERVASYNQETNLYLYSGLQSLGLTVLPTDLRTAIQVVASDKPDFYQRLLRVGIETESLKAYRVTLGGRDGYGNSAVRMLTPAPGQLDEVLTRMEIALK